MQKPQKTKKRAKRCSSLCYRAKDSQQFALKLNSL